ncbi:MULTISPECIES: hypothetical protein [unclassified Rickettsia]
MTTAKKLDINPDGCVGTALKNMGNYAAKWNGISTKELFTKYDVTNPYCSFDNKIEQDRQNQETILNVELKAPESLPEPEEQIVNTNYTASSLKISKELLGEKVTLINGKEVEVKKFLELLYNQNTKEFDFLLKMLPSDTSEVMKKEVTLKLAYDYFKDSKNFDETNAISERIGTSDIFEEYLGFNIDQFKSEEMNIMGGDQHSYLDFSA